MTRRTHQLEAALSEELERVLGLRNCGRDGFLLWDIDGHVVYIGGGQTIGEALKAGRGKG